MTPYGKVAQAAISATSLLAEHYAAEGGKRLNSREIAERRKLSQAIVGKVLTTLSQINLVIGSPGPGGGYTLARPPQTITLSEVIAPFKHSMKVSRARSAKAGAARAPNARSTSNSLNSAVRSQIF